MSLKSGPYVSFMSLKIAKSHKGKRFCSNNAQGSQKKYIKIGRRLEAKQPQILERIFEGTTFSKLFWPFTTK